MLCFYLFVCVQIVLESFPVSSSGHVVLLQKMLHKFFVNDLPGACHENFFSQHVGHFLHGPTVFILMIFFFREWSFYFVHIRVLWKKIIKLLALVALADSITVVFYFFFKFVGTSWFPVWVGFLVSAAVLFSLRFKDDSRRAKGRFTWKKALMLGLVQGLAFLPGISRLGLVFSVAYWMGLSRKKSFEISFLIQWPLIAGAFVNSVFIRKMYSSVTSLRLLFDVQTVVVMLCASVVSFFALWFFERVVYENKVWMFSFYLLGVAILWLVV